MCCNNNPEYVMLLKKSWGNKKWVKCWKVLRSDGRSFYTGTKFYPGHYKLLISDYDSRRPQGFHVYTKIPNTSPFVGVCSLDRIVAVWCKTSTLLVASEHPDEAVFSEIKILEKDWNNSNIGECPPYPMSVININDYDGEKSIALRKAVRWINSNMRDINTFQGLTYQEIEFLRSYLHNNKMWCQKTLQIQGISEVFKHV